MYKEGARPATNIEIDCLMTVTTDKPKTAMTARTILLCSCEGTMPLDSTAVAKGCGKARIVPATQLCGPQLDLFRKAAANGTVTVACTAQRALFEEVAEDDDLKASLTFANVRETAGWSTEAASAAPKMAALLAIAAIDVPAPTAVTFTSEGVALIYGPGQIALDAAAALKDRLDITVLLSDAGDVTPPATNEFPIRRGRIKTVKGHLGAFEITIDGFAAPAPSSRRSLAFGAARNGAISNADILIDLSGLKPLVNAHDLREGYLRADPNDPVAVAEAAVQSRRPHRNLRQATLRRIPRRPVRPFALAQDRLHPLP